MKPLTPAAKADANAEYRMRKSWCTGTVGKHLRARPLSQPAAARRHDKLSVSIRIRHCVQLAFMIISLAQGQDERIDLKQGWSIQSSEKVPQKGSEISST